MYGKPTFESVLSFALQVAHTVNPEAVEKFTQEKRTEGSSSSTSQSSGTASLSEVDAESWTKLCDPKSSKLCAIAFLSNGESSSSFQHELDTAQVFDHFTNISPP